MKCTIFHGLGIRLDEAKGRWAKELPSIRWAYHTTLKTSTNETPFSLAFGMEIVILVEIGLPIMWIEHYDESSNPVQLRANLDLLEETRDKACLRMDVY